MSLYVKMCPPDVLASLEGWRRQRLGLDLGGEQAHATPSTTGEASSSRENEADVESAHVSSRVGEGPSARRTPLPSMEVRGKGSLQRASITAGLQKTAMKEATRGHSLIHKVCYLFQCGPHHTMEENGAGH